jgi:hypothetical protein
MATQPDMILQFAHLLKETYQNKTISINGIMHTIKNPKIFCEGYVSLNGRPSQPFLDQRIDLSKQPYNLSHRNWVLPFQP